MEGGAETLKSRRRPPSRGIAAQIRFMQLPIILVSQIWLCSFVMSLVTFAIAKKRYFALNSPDLDGRDSSMKTMSARKANGWQLIPRVPSLC